MGASCLLHLVLLQPVVEYQHSLTCPMRFAKTACNGGLDAHLEFWLQVFRLRQGS